MSLQRNRIMNNKSKYSVLTVAVLISLAVGDGSTDTISFAPTTARYPRLYMMAWTNEIEGNHLDESEIYP